MNDDTKVMLMSLSVAVIIAATITGTIGGVSWLFNKSEEGRFNRSIECKEIGGVMVYESNVWICK